MVINSPFHYRTIQKSIVQGRGSIEEVERDKG